MSDTTSPTKMQFRKRKKKNRNNTLKSIASDVINDTEIKNNETDHSKHNKTTNDNHDIDEEDDDLSFLKILKETKTIHKLQFKSKDKGLVFEERHEFTSSGLDNPDNFRHDPSKDFGESFSTEKLQDDKLKKKREEWIEKEMRNKLLRQGRVLPQNEAKKSHIANTSLKEQLYALPHTLSAALDDGRDTSFEAGERWLAGMAEYELPLEFKLKNIKETEDAKRKLLEPKPKQHRMFDIPRNYNQDFTTHHFERVKTAEHKRKLQETQEQLSLERDKKRRRLMGTDWYNKHKNNNDTPLL